MSASTSGLRIIPLGGLGEIGMNCMALEVGKQILLIDCGVTFPNSDLGVDIYHPDFSWLEDRAEDVVGLVITHGHEDHIGAVPYLLGELDIPVWGPRHALELVRNRLQEHQFRPGEVDLHYSEPQRRFTAGGFEIEPLSVTHSIADSTGLVIRTDAGTVVHTGDFKLDGEPGIGPVTDEAGFRRAGEEGVDLLLSDSTNVDAHGQSGSESDVAGYLMDMVRGCPRRVVVGLFASNLHRMKAMGEVAIATGRHLVLLGRSVVDHAAVGRKLGLLNWPDDLVRSPEQSMELPPDRVLALASGSQGQYVAALNRIADGRHYHFDVEPGDCVIFSSRVIPGLEPQVNRLVGKFLRRGVDVRTRRSHSGVHVSGHAHRDEQRRMLDWVQPRAFVPVHGTTWHLHRHAELAQKHGVVHTLVLENGEVGELGDGLDKAHETVPFAKLPAYRGFSLERGTVEERRRLARHGVVFLTLVIGPSGQPLGPVQLTSRGVLDERRDAQLAAEICRDVEDLLRRKRWREHEPPVDDVASLACRHARRMVDQRKGFRPMVAANVVRRR